MKLISLNIEGRKHYDRVRPFLEEEKADVLCLMEVPEEFGQILSEQGYQTSFAPMFLKSLDPYTVYVSGLLFASKQPYKTESFYYQPPATAILWETGAQYAETAGRPVIFASNDIFNIATTHFTWNPSASNEHQPQANVLPVMQKYLANKPPHVFCGDMNIPRKLSPYATTLMEGYNDAIPATYSSSLDKDLHRKGTDPNLQHLFASYMVDHLLTQPPYQAHDVRLQFGVSDHAAVIAEITRD